MRPFLHSLLLALLLPAIGYGADDLVTTMKKAGDFSFFLKSIKTAGLTETLDHGGSYTIFAPTDAAFNKLPSESLEALFLPQNKQKLTSIVEAHIVRGKVMAADIKTTTAITFGKAPMNVTREGATMTFEGATVIRPNIPANNGIIHAIDKVALPDQENSPLPPSGPAKKPKAVKGRKV